MKNAKHTFILIVLIALLLPGLSQSVEAWGSGWWETSQTYGAGTHGDMFDRAFETLRSDGYDDIADYFDSYEQSLKKGSCDSDGCTEGEWGAINARFHYMQPFTHEGLWFLVLHQSAGVTADGYYTNGLSKFVAGDITGAMEQFGGMFHLIQDLTNPYHAAGDHGGLPNTGNTNNYHKGYESLAGGWIDESDGIKYYVGPGMYELNPNDGTCAAGDTHCQPHANRKWPHAWVDYASHMSYEFYPEVRVCNPYSGSTDPCTTAEKDRMEEISKQMGKLAVSLTAGAMKKLYLEVKQVLHLTFETGVVDESVHHHSEQNYGTARAYPSVRDYSAIFYGNEKITIGDMGNPGAGTLMFWMNLNNKNSGPEYLMDGRGTGNWWLLQDYKAGDCTDTTGNVCFNSRVQIRASSIDSNKWHHVTVTSDSSESRIYLDGNLMDTGSGLAMDLRSVRLGTRYTNSHYLQGKLDEVRIFETVLSERIIKEIYDSEITPIKHYKLDGSIQDETTGYHGSFYSWTSDPPSNMLVNGGFESGSLYPWKTTTYQSAVTTNSWHVIEGSRGLRLYRYQNPTFHPSFIEQIVDIPVNQIKEISFQLRAYTTTKVSLFYEDGSSWTKSYSANRAWGKIILPRHELDNSKTLIRMKIERIGASGSGTAVDDVKIIPYTVPYTLAMQEKGVQFDGNDYIKVRRSTDPLLESIRNELTMSAWVYPTKSGGEQQIINKENDYEIALKNGRLYWAIRTNTHTWEWIDTGRTIPLNQWSHVVVTYDGYAVESYHNSFNYHVYSYQHGTISNSQRDLGIGARRVDGSPYSYFYGMIDDVRIYPLALRPEKITDLFLEGVTQLHLSLDTDAYDDSLRGSRGTEIDMLYGIDGSHAGAIFTGDNTILAHQSTAMQSIGDSMTFSVWIKPDRTYSNEPNQWAYFAHSFAMNGGFQYEFGYQGWNDAVEFKALATNGQTYAVKKSMSLTMDTWYHIKVTIDKNVMTLYIDGAYAASRTDFPSGQLSIPWDTYLGRYGGSATSGFEGWIDDFTIYGMSI